MKTTDRAVLSGLFLIALLAAFYFLVLAPKRQEASKLGTDIAALEASISEQEQTVAFAEEARKSFPKYYGRMVVLGKAAPEQADSAVLQIAETGNGIAMSIDGNGRRVACDPYTGTIEGEQVAGGQLQGGPPHLDTLRVMRPRETRPLVDRQIPRDGQKVRR